LTTFLYSQHLQETRLFTELFQTFNERYDRLNHSLNEIAGSARVGLSADSQQLLMDYFNLCAEEYLYFRSRSRRRLGRTSSLAAPQGHQAGHADRDGQTISRSRACCSQCLGGRAVKRATKETAAGRRYLDLQREARRTGRPTDELTQLYALECFLDRLHVDVNAGSNQWPLPCESRSGGSVSI
jgi:hypothetical protein